MNSSVESLRAKAIARSLLDPADQAMVDTLPRRMPDSVGRRRARRSLAKAADNLAGEVERAVAMPDESAALRRLRVTMLAAFGRAYRMGSEVCGLPDWDITVAEADVIVDVVEAELAAFVQYRRDRRRAEEGASSRSRLYGGAVGAMFWRGWLAALPSDARIRWMLGVAEHCRDCLDLAWGGPYGKPGSSDPTPLPTVPRNGDTRCLGNCRCSLRSVVRGVLSLLDPVIGAEVVRIGALDVEPTSPGAVAAAAYYQEFAERRAFALRSAELLDGDARLAMIVAADRSGQAALELAATLGHEIRWSATDEEIIEPIGRALRSGLEPVAWDGQSLLLPDDVRSVEDLLVLGYATVLSIDGVRRGRIASASADPPTVTLDDGTSHRLDDVGRAILFLDRRLGR